MNKEEKTLTIPIEKAWIIGIINTLVVSVLYALIISKFINVWIDYKENWSTLCLQAVNTANSCSNSNISFFIILLLIIIILVGTSTISFLIFTHKKETTKKDI